MVAVADARYFHSNATSGEQLFDAAFRWFLTTAALLSIAVGAVILYGPLTTIEPLVPLALFLIGWGAMAGLVALYWWEVTLPLDTALPANSPPTASGPIPVRDASRTSMTGPRNRIPRLSSRGSAWRVLAAPTGPGDETWLSWLPRETRRLGVEGAGSSRGAAYAVGRPGSLVAVPTRAESSVPRTVTMPGDFARSAREKDVSGEPAIPAEPTGSPARSEGPVPAVALPRRRSRIYSEEELDSMFPPPPGGHSVFLSAIPDRIGRSSEPARAASGRPESFGRADASTRGFEHAPTDVVERSVIGWGRPLSTERPTGAAAAIDAGGSVAAREFEFLPDVLPTSELLAREAANPVPPHLRMRYARSSPDERRPRSGSPDLGDLKSVCASCSKVVVNLRMSGPCPECLRPICQECLRESIVAHGQGQCIDCASTDEIAAS